MKTVYPPQTKFAGGIINDCDKGERHNKSMMQNRRCAAMMGCIHI